MKFYEKKKLLKCQKVFPETWYIDITWFLLTQFRTNFKLLFYPYECQIFKDSFLTDVYVIRVKF